MGWRNDKRLVGRWMAMDHLLLSAGLGIVWLGGRWNWMAV
jgi:hypothetical protein